jgi:hypothetical protein
MRAAALLFALAIAGCGSNEEPNSGPGGVSPDEARQLDEAAARADINATFASNEAEPTP